MLIFPAFIPFIGETGIHRSREAGLPQRAGADPISGLITLSVHTDHDFSGYDLDAPVEDVQVSGTQGLFEPPFAGVANRDSLTLRDIGNGMRRGVRCLNSSGTADQVPIGSRSRSRARGRRLHGLGGPNPRHLQPISSTRGAVLQRRGLFRRPSTPVTRCADHLGLGAATFDAPQRNPRVGRELTSPGDTRKWKHADAE